MASGSGSYAGRWQLPPPSTRISTLGSTKRSQFCAYTAGTAPASFVVRIPLNRLFGFCREGMPVIYGQPVSLRFYPSRSLQYIQKTSTAIAYDFYINSMDLFLNVKKPSAAVAARIQDALAQGAKTRIQYNDFATFQFTGQGQTDLHHYPRCAVLLPHVAGAVVPPVVLLQRADGGCRIAERRVLHLPEPYPER